MVSVVVDSVTQSPVAVKVWDDYGRHIEAFRHCLALWQDEKGYRPI